jgi:uncharacterized protein
LQLLRCNAIALSVCESEIIKALNLIKLEPEGGHFVQTYKAPLQITTNGNSRALLTCIYYLLTKTSFSAFHRLSSTEVYNYYAGSRAELFLIENGKPLKRFLMGTNILAGETPQVVVPPGTWQASRLFPNEACDWALLGTTVAPGFEFDDFELAKREHLVSLHPESETLIASLTRESEM